MDKEKKDQVTELTERLEDGIKNMMNSEDYPLQEASLSIDPVEDVHREQPAIEVEPLSHPGRSR